MAKKKYICQKCGAASPKWEGRCSHCGEWNTLTEEIVEKAKNLFLKPSSQVADLKSAAQETHNISREKTGIAELDRVLGGGLVPGAFVLLGGPPGIGKSTLLLQMSEGLSRRGKALYVCSEESIQQTGLRAKRLQIEEDNIFLYNESSVEEILKQAQKLKPKFLIVDSIQSVYLSELSSAPGAVSQVRECASVFMNFAKSSQTSVVIIGHVTKDGGLAGPRVLEHIVDAVLSFEGQSHCRILKASKNRFGAVGELGIFQMSETGLQEVENPSEFFLEERGEDPVGSVVFTTMEGKRPLLCEIQALIVPSFLALPRRNSIGIEINHLHKILAVLEKYFQIPFSKHDVFLNLAGGMRLTEPAGDLAAAAAILSSYYKKPVAGHACFFGEIGLTGEVRSCPFGKERILEAEKLGFQSIYMPKMLVPSSKIKTIPIQNIKELASLF